MDRDQPPDEPFSAWLRRSLAAKPWTREQLAEALGHSSDRTVYRWLEGKNVPRGATLRHVERVLESEWVRPPAVTATTMADELAALRQEVAEVHALLRKPTNGLRVMLEAAAAVAAQRVADEILAEAHSQFEEILVVLRRIERHPREAAS